MWAFSALAAINLIFHVCTADEYYTGILVLPEGNGVTDGSIILYTILIVAGTFGPDVFIKEAYSGWKVNEIIVLFVVVSQTMMIIKTIKNIINHDSKEKQPDDPAGERLVKKDWSL